MNKKRIVNLIAFMLVLSVFTGLISAASYYNVSLHYKSGNIEILDANVISSDFNLNEKYGEYSVVVMSKGEVVSSNKFQPILTEIVDDFEDSGSSINEKNDVVFSVFVPYKEGDKIVVYGANGVNGKELAKDDVNNFLKTGNRNIIQNDSFFWVIACIILFVILAVFYFFRKKRF